MQATFCDNCNQGITEGQSDKPYRLALSIYFLPQKGPKFIGGKRSYPIERTHHFCNLNCLRGWMADRH